MRRRAQGELLDQLKGVFYRVSRALEAILPLDLLWLLLWPLSAILAVRHLRLTDARVPVAVIPSPRAAARPSTWSRWRYLTRFQEHWWLLGWLDRLPEQRWQKRLDVVGLDHLREALAERPVIIVALHTTSLVALAAMIQSQGVTTATIPVDSSWFSSDSRQRKVRLAEQTGAAVFGKGSARQIVEFLQPGASLVIAIDYDASGRMIDVPASGAVVRVSTGAFRLARTAHAAIVPVLMTHSGRWRYRMHVLDAVPQAFIEGADYEAAAGHAVAQLLPLVRNVPEQAMGDLVDAVKPWP